ncbi:hypothetical protein B9Z51_02100 [Limnohabitans sp. T6-5]|uniref:hypothetical protein n=1 Tax=Limnohabitans sp. T6-5 TaxID=1100724 RepID=UPI000D381291|nr:hypothetical protein [Limnohabitans sp. T6-5]PUE11133.1 hypothetical protein B9Z51_02100 [Limnohabitans sp. T6-5]
MTPLRSQIRNTKIFIVACNLFILAFVFEKAYHEFMLHQYGFTPIEQLPIIEGIVSKADWCKKSKYYWTGPVEIETIDHQIITQITPCLSDFIPREKIKGISIKIIKEEWNFPSPRNEKTLKIIANNITIQDYTKGRSLKNYYSIFDLIIYILWLSLGAGLQVFYRQSKKQIIKHNQIVNKEKNKLLFSIQQNKDFSGAKILEITNNHGITRNGVFEFEINIYFKKDDGTYWHSYSDRLRKRTSQIPESVGKFRWP